MFRLATLDHATAVEDEDLIRHHARTEQVVGDVEQAEPALLAQPSKQPEHAGSQRHVEHRHRLVGHDEVGIAGERSGDHYTLTLATGELVRQLRCELLGRSQTTISSSSCTRRNASRADSPRMF